MDPGVFTSFVAQQHRARVGEMELSRGRFELDESWRQDIEEAVRRAPKQKAVGSDEVFAEVLQLQPTMVAELLHRLWECCGKHGIFPKAWCESVL